MRRLLTFVLLFAPATSSAQERPAEGQSRPWFTLVVSRFDRLLDHADVLLQAAGKPELSEVLSDRYRRWQNFGGLDRTRPMGLLWIWRSDDPLTEATEAHDELVFIPFQDVHRLMQTVTFGAVTYQEVQPGHYQIDRPVIPYHAVVHDGVLWMGDQPAMLRRFAPKLPAVTRDLVRDFDLACAWDLRQVPTEQRRAWTDAWEQEIEPALQRGDDEPESAHRWRTLLGRWLLHSLHEAMLTLDRVVIGVKLDPQRKRADVELRLEAGPRGLAADSWLAWPAQRTTWVQLDKPEAFTAGSVQIPWTTSDSADRPDRLSRAEFAWQVWGDPYAVRTTIVALRIPGLADDAAAAAPISGDTFRAAEITFRRTTAMPIPAPMKRFTGWDPQIWLGCKQEAVWLAFGPPEPAAEKLKAALEAIAQPPAAPLRPAAVQMHVSARDVIPFVPWFSPDWADDQLRKGGDQLRLRIEPHAAGLTAKLQMEAGLLRLLGASLAEDLANELEHTLSLP